MKAKEYFGAYSLTTLDFEINRNPKHNSFELNIFGKKSEQCRRRSVHPVAD